MALIQWQDMNRQSSDHYKSFLATYYSIQTLLVSSHYSNSFVWKFEGRVCDGFNSVPPLRSRRTVAGTSLPLDGQPLGHAAGLHQLTPPLGLDNQQQPDEHQQQK